MPLGCFLISVGEREDVHFAEAGAGDLEADGHAIFRKAAGEGDGWQAISVEGSGILFGIGACGSFRCGGGRCRGRCRAAAASTTSTSAGGGSGYQHFFYGRSRVTSGGGDQ